MPWELAELRRRPGREHSGRQRDEEGRNTRTIDRILFHIEAELGYEEGEPSTEAPGRWTFSQGAAALSELRAWLLAMRDGGT